MDNSAQQDIRLGPSRSQRWPGLLFVSVCGRQLWRPYFITPEVDVVPGATRQFTFWQSFLMISRCGRLRKTMMSLPAACA
jgi:hypothetical protein